MVTGLQAQPFFEDKETRSRLAPPYCRLELCKINLARSNEVPSGELNEGTN